MNNLSSKRVPHQVIKGLAGCGKSYEINRYINEMILKKVYNSRNVILFSFNRKIKEKNISKFSWSFEKNTYTIHSFCYAVLNEYNLLPDVFKDISLMELEDGIEGVSELDGDIIGGTRELLSKDYDLLISKFLDIPNYYFLESEELYSTYIKALKCIIADEAQDLREDYVEVIEKLKGLASNPQVIIAGDNYQNINKFQDKTNDKKISDILKNPKLLFKDEEYNETILNKNHRAESNPALNIFMNSFIIKNPKYKEKITYNILGEIKEKDKPFICYFKDNTSQYNYVKKESLRLIKKGESVAILSRTNKALEVYKELADDGISVSTVHKAKGDEFDFVFIVNFNYDIDDDEEIDTITYTAISRAKKGIFITSSFPYKEDKLEAIFDKETYSLKKLSKVTYEKFSYLNDLGWKKPKEKKLEHGKNYSCTKIHGNLIDSLCLKVSYKDIPFAPHIKRNNTNQHMCSPTRRVKPKDGAIDIEYSISRHAKGSYIFHFLDINLLKKNGLSDIDIVYHCMNIVTNYFDERIKRADIKIHRLDLNVLLGFESKELYLKYYNEILIPLLMDVKKGLVVNHKGTALKTKEDFINALKDKATIYINHHKDKNNGINTAIYNPFFKTNMNKINMKNILKIEMRMKGRFLNKKKSFNGYDANVVGLLQMITNNELQGLFYNQYDFYIGEHEQLLGHII